MTDLGRATTVELMHLRRRPAHPAKNEAVSPPSAPANLHIAVSQRIVGRHQNQSRIPLDQVRFVIKRLVDHAGTPAESKDNARLREHLERATGLSIAELAELSKRWPV